MTYQLLNGVLVIGQGNTFGIQNNHKRQYGTAQIHINGGSASVNLQGRTSSNMPWSTVHTFTTDGDAQSVVLFNEMAANVTAISGGAIVTLELTD